MFWNMPSVTFASFAEEGESALNRADKAAGGQQQLELVFDTPGGLNYM